MIRNTAIIALVSALILSACATAPVKEVDPGNGTVQRSVSIDRLAKDYLKLTLAMGEIEAGYVDAYYGPEKFAAAAKANPATLAELGSAISKLTARARLIDTDSLEPLQKRRRAFLLAQLKAAGTRHAMLSGKRLSFRQESLGLFGATPDLKPLSSYDPLLAKIAKLVPGKGDLAARVDAFQNRYTIPKDRLKPVFDAAISECKARTTKRMKLPKGESFTMEFVTGKSWSGYNYYQGGYKSLIQINTDLPIRISRAVDLGCHEGYPGHHALNMLLEQRLTNERGWQEFSVYPLYSPQSLIAEGSANYGIDLAFPGNERLTFERDILYPLAGLDPKDAAAYHQLQTALSQLSGARFTIAQKYLDGEMTKEQAIAATQKYQLVSAKRAQQSISFTDQYRSYVINYGLGQDMVRAHIERGNVSAKEKWRRMEDILSEPTLPSDLLR
ncbi:MAG: hypothetical protein V3V15_03260 [Sphingorhabdus sp.]